MSKKAKRNYKSKNQIIVDFRLFNCKIFLKCFINFKCRGFFFKISCYPFFVLFLFENFSPMLKNILNKFIF